MTLLKPPASSTGVFMYHPTDQHFVGCISDTAGMGRVYDDACDDGLTLVSTTTGREIVFVVEHVEARDSDLMWWALRPVDSTCPFKMTLFND